MLKVLGLVLCIALVSPLHAANIITFGKNSDVIFPHKEHQKIYIKCTECHGSIKPGRFANFGEIWAHANCSGCHSKVGAGPVDCFGCHANI